MDPISIRARAMPRLIKRVKGTPGFHLDFRKLTIFPSRMAGWTHQDNGRNSEPFHLL